MNLEVTDHIADGFVLPLADLSVSDASRASEGVRTVAQHIAANRGANQEQAKANAASAALETFTSLPGPDDANMLLWLLAGRPAGAWWDVSGTSCTIAVRAEALFVLLLGQEYWPLAPVGANQSSLWAGTFHVPEALNSELVFDLFVASDSSAVVDDRYMTCTLTGPGVDLHSHQAHAWRRGTTTVQPLATAPFSGARLFSHWCVGASASSPHLVVVDGDLAWAAATWLSALACAGVVPPVVVHGITAADSNAWASIRTAALTDPTSSAHRSYDTAIDELIAGVASDAPIIYAGFSLGAVWALERALRDPRATAVISQALAGSVAVAQPVNPALRLYLVDCIYDQSSLRWTGAAHTSLTQIGVTSTYTEIPTRHSAESLPLAISSVLSE